jgi:hypothetical protein
MKDFSLAEALRYVTAGFTFLVCLHVYSPKAAADVVKGIGEIGVLGMSLAFGAVAYPVYRGLFYNKLMTALQDHWPSSRLNYRRWVARNWPDLDDDERYQVWLALRSGDKTLADGHKASDASIANVHVGYMSAIVILGFAVASFMTGSRFNGLWLLIVFGVTFCGTFAFHRRFEADELGRLLRMSREDIEKITKPLCKALRRARTDAPNDELRSDEGTSSSLLLSSDVDVQPPLA